MVDVMPQVPRKDSQPCPIKPTFNSNSKKLSTISNIGQDQPRPLKTLKKVAKILKSGKRHIEITIGFLMYQSSAPAPNGA